VPADEDSHRGRHTEALLCRDVCVDFGGVRALDDVAIEVGPGEVVALLGASGSGKSTLLNTVAGLVSPSKGEIWVAGRRVLGERHTTPPEHRDVGMVFQSFALWPHLSVLDTVAYPLRRAGLSARAAAAKATDLLVRLEIDQLAGRRPAELSGGEQQRVGLARALAREARLYLLDEPTAHLDTHLRVAFQESVLARQRESGAAVVYATHDATEALALADRVALMVSGRLIQLATPGAVYAEPVNLAAAELTGPCSVLAARVAAGQDGALSVDLGDGAISIVDNTVGYGRDGEAHDQVAPQPHTRLQPPARPRRLMVRPDWIYVGGPLTGQVTSVAFRGTHTDYLLQAGAASVLMSLPGPARYRRDDVVPWGLTRVWLLDADDLHEPAGIVQQPSRVTQVR
jgi:iron(III) transport system ATP-binding protein